MFGLPVLELLYNAIVTDIVCLAFLPLCKDFSFASPSSCMFSRDKVGSAGRDEAIVRGTKVGAIVVIGVHAGIKLIGLKVDSSNVREA